MLCLCIADFGRAVSTRGAFIRVELRKREARPLFPADENRRSRLLDRCIASWDDLVEFDVSDD